MSQDKDQIEPSLTPFDDLPISEAQPFYVLNFNLDTGEVFSGSKYQLKPVNLPSTQVACSRDQFESPHDFKVVNGEVHPANPEESAAKKRILLVGQIKQGLTLLINTVAIEWGFDDIRDAASFVTSSRPAYRARALALVEWRDACWEAAEAQFDTVSGVTADEFIAGLPKVPALPAA